MTDTELREQLEEFALHMKPGTTRGKHRTAIFDTLELAKLVQAFIAQEANKAVVDALQGLEYAREEAKGADSFISKYITKYIRELTAEKGKA
jgi:hypothetical protein